MTRNRIVLVALTALGALAASAGALAQPEGRVVPFDAFRDSLRTAPLEAYARRPGVRVERAADFEEMRQHLIELYGAMKVSHSFALETDVYDCVPIDQQPAVRLQGITHIAEPPRGVPASRALPDKTAGAPDSRAARLEGRRAAAAARQVALDTPKDRFGNSTRCEAKTIPMRRITLD